MSAPPVIPLTPRQQQIVDRIAHGKRSKEIAVELGLSPFTVKKQLELAAERTGIHGRLALVLRYGRTP